MSTGTLFGDARAAFGFTDAAWRAFVQRWSGLDDDASLYADTPDARRGSTRVVDRLIVAGWTNPILPYVSAGYLLMVARLNGRGPGESADMQTALRLADQPPAWPLLAMTGRTFQIVVGHYHGLGYAMPELLARRWMTPDRLAEVADARKALSVDDRRFAELLRDVGGGALHVEQLDEAGFDRLLLALDVIAVRDVVETENRPAPAPQARTDAVARLWPGLATRL